MKRAKRVLSPPVYSLRGIRAYDELQIVVTEVGQVKETVKLVSSLVDEIKPGYTCTILIKRTRVYFQLLSEYL